MSPEDSTAIKAIAADYIEGWYGGDVARMKRALHDDLVKRITVHEEGSGSDTFRAVTKERMVELTAAGGGAVADPTFEVVVDDVSGEIATARTVSPEFVDYLHLVKTSDGWKIANVLFKMR